MPEQRRPKLWPSHDKAAPVQAEPDKLSALLEKLEPLLAGLDNAALAGMFMPPVAGPSNAWMTARMLMGAPETIRQRQAQGGDFILGKDLSDYMAERGETPRMAKKRQQ